MTQLCGRGWGCCVWKKLPFTAEGATLQLGTMISPLIWGMLALDTDSDVGCVLCVSVSDLSRSHLLYV